MGKTAPAIAPGRWTTARNSFGAWRFERIMLRVLLSSIAVGALAGPCTASAAGLRLERLAVASSAAVASAEHRTTAYLSAPGTLVVGVAGRGEQSMAISPACIPTATTTRTVAMRCTLQDGERNMVLDLETRTVTPLQLPSGVSGRIASIGERWAVVDARSSPDDLHVVQSRLLIDWHTQRIVSLGRDDPYGAHRYIDLDAAEPGRRLCSPVARILENGFDDMKYAEVAKQGAWTLTYESLHGPLVQRCGQRTRRRLPRVSQPVLGNDFVGYVDGHRVIYLDLRTGRRQTRAWPTGQRPELAAAGRRLIISAPIPGGTYRLYRSRQP
jgi:hypothetical protein